MLSRMNSQQFSYIQPQMYHPQIFSSNINPEDQMIFSQYQYQPQMIESIYDAEYQCSNQNAQYIPFSGSQEEIQDSYKYNSMPYFNNNIQYQNNQESIPMKQQYYNYFEDEQIYEQQQQPIDDGNMDYIQQQSSQFEQIQDPQPIPIDIVQENNSAKEASSILEDKGIHKRSIKKSYKPKKKYNQSRQKNVFKNFGNALMNFIQNNFMIRDFIEKNLNKNKLAIEAFHKDFLKESLNNLKNKEDFLQGWRQSSQSDSSQNQLFKKVFKDLSIKFFNEYAEKYVNESDKLKNKDIHIKAIPIFLKGIENVNELYKFKLS